MSKQNGNKGRIFLGPAFAYQRQSRFVILDDLGRCIDARSLRVSTMEKEMRHPLGVTRGKGNRNGTPLRYSKKRKLVQPRRIDDYLKIANPGLERQMEAGMRADDRLRRTVVYLAFWGL